MFTFTGPCAENTLGYSTSECVSTLHLSQFISSMSRNSKAEAPHDVPFIDFEQLGSYLLSAELQNHGDLVILCLLSTFHQRY